MPRPVGPLSPSDLALCPQAFKPEEVSENFWIQINSNDSVFIDIFGLKSVKAVSSLYVLPLFFEKHPFGFIALFGIKKDALEQVDSDYIRALRHIFELWACKINIKKRFEDVVDFIPNPTFIMTTDERIVVWNRANEEMTGWKAEQLIGRDGYESSVPYYFIRRPMVANLIMKPDETWEKTYFEFIRDGDTVHSLAFCPALPGGGAYLRTKTLRLYDVQSSSLGRHSRGPRCHPRTPDA
jgi:PAS domain S-box-containing protein